MKRKWLPWLYIVPFLALLMSMPLMSILTEDLVKSESENRNLQQFPGYRSLVKLNMTKSLEAYVTDQLPMRDKMVTYYNRLSLMMDKRLIRNLYVTDSMHLIQLPPRLKFQAIDEAVTKTKNLTLFVSELDKDLLFAFTPKKSSGLQESLLGIFYRNHMGYVDYFAQQLQEKSNITNFYNLSKAWRVAYTAQERDSFYYKTDFHWNAIGAIKAFEILITKFNTFKGFETVVFDPTLFTYVSTQEKQFLGDFDRRLQFQYPISDESGYYMMPDADQITSWLYVEGAIQLKHIDEIYATGVTGAEVDYNKLFTKNYGYYKVQNLKALNPTKLLILKDSYQNAMLPFFVKYFAQVEVVDQRFIQNGDCYSLIEASDADAVLVLYNDGVVYGDMFNFNKP